MVYIHWHAPDRLTSDQSLTVAAALEGMAKYELIEWLVKASATTGYSATSA